MKEIGGYIELDTYMNPMLHDDGIKLNCGRNAFAYILKAKSIKKIYFPKFMCDSNDQVLAENGVEVIYYSIGLDFKLITHKHIFKIHFLELILYILAANFLVYQMEQFYIQINS